MRPDETSATVRCHYLTDGSVNFAFAIRRAEFFIPVGVLLKCLLEVSDRELFGYLAAAAPRDAGEGMKTYQSFLDALRRGVLLTYVNAIRTGVWC